MPKKRKGTRSVRVGGMRERGNRKEREKERERELHLSFHQRHYQPSDVTEREDLRAGVKSGQTQRRVQRERPREILTL